MQIKTITCHDVYNTGASLQAYALVAYLNQLGHEAEIIDYKPDYLSNHFSLTLVPNRRFDRPVIRQMYLSAKLPGRLKERNSKRKKNFDQFRERYLPLTKRYQSLEELKRNPPQAQLYLAGSDQIWNTTFQNGRDAAFYLTFAPKNSVKASYAASFATEQIEPNWQKTVREWIKQLDFISVRESSGLQILDQLGIHGAQHVLDPVFLLNRSDWENLCGGQPGTEPYLFVYDFDRSLEMRAIAEQLAAARGLKLYTLQDLGYGDRNFAEAGPLEFLTLIRHASVVLSNSFHATAFSMLFEREFWVMNRQERINTRMRDLTESVGLANRLIAEKEQVTEDEIDYAVVRTQLQRYVNSSRAYLDMVIQETQKA